MNKREISEEDFVDVLKSGYQWHANKIKDEIEQLLVHKSSAYKHDLDFSERKSQHYINDNECFLFIFDGKIELHSARENVDSTGRTITYEINSADDISSAYRHFKSLITEVEEE